MVLLLITLAVAGSGLELPPGEASAEWAGALALAGLPLGAGVHVEVDGETWVLRTVGAGASREARIPRPTSARGREDVALLAASLLHPGPAVQMPALEAGAPSRVVATAGAGGPARAAPPPVAATVERGSASASAAPPASPRASTPSTPPAAPAPPRAPAPPAAVPPGAPPAEPAVAALVPPSSPAARPALAPTAPATTVPPVPSAPVSSAPASSAPVSSAPVSSPPVPSVPLLGEAFGAPPPPSSGSPVPAEPSEVAEAGAATADEHVSIELLEAATATPEVDGAPAATLDRRRAPSPGALSVSGAVGVVGAVRDGLSPGGGVTLLGSLRRGPVVVSVQGTGIFGAHAAMEGLDTAGATALTTARGALLVGARAPGAAGVFAAAGPVVDVLVFREEGADAQVGPVPGLTLQAGAGWALATSLRAELVVEGGVDLRRVTFARAGDEVATMGSTWAGAALIFRLGE